MDLVKSFHILDLHVQDPVKLTIFNELRLLIDREDVDTKLLN
jgi:hypothetical protein